MVHGYALSGLVVPCARTGSGHFWTLGQCHVQSMAQLRFIELTEWLHNAYTSLFFGFVAVVASTASHILLSWDPLTFCLYSLVGVQAVSETIQRKEVNVRSPVCIIFTLVRILAASEMRAFRNTGLFESKSVTGAEALRRARRGPTLPLVRAACGVPFHIPDTPE
eukprot:6206767-Pleurochrysis_carterae.AAC.2